MIDKIQKIREECIKVNPKILELSIGCKVEVHIDEEEVKINTIGELMGCEIGIYVESEEIEVSTIKSMQGEEENYIKIIGRDVRLADIIDLIDKNPRNKHPIIWWTNVENILDIKNADMKDVLFFIASNWKLQDDNLESQTEECINFIYKLIENK